MRFNSAVGLTKRWLEEVESRGWDSLATVVCSTCVTEPTLAEAIRSYEGADECDYCGSVPHTPDASAPADLLLASLVDGLRFEYDDPVNEMAWDGEYIGAPLYETWDLIAEFEITDSDSLNEDLVHAIAQDQWCQRNPYETRRDEALTYGWDAFRSYIKHRRRFTYLTRTVTAGLGAGDLPMHAVPSAIAETVEETGLVRTLPAGEEWWRIRTHAAGLSYSTAVEIGTPPDAVARDNRMTPKGIGAFYGSSSLDTARKEVASYAAPTDWGSAGRFTTTKDLAIVDLREIPPVPSLFDESRRHLRAPIRFLHSFVADITKVADPGHAQDLEYVPTQAIAETFRYELKGAVGPVDGVMWRSSRDLAESSCVLLIPSQDVADLGSEDARTKLLLDPASVTLLRSRSLRSRLLALRVWRMGKRRTH